MACTVKELQSFLVERGVVVGDKRKLELAELFEIAREINLQVDPDDLIEDGNDVIAEKLKDVETVVSYPAISTGTQDPSMLSYFNVMDVFSYLLTNNSSFSQIRDCQKSEGYSLMTDGFVKHVETVTVTFEQPGYFALKARVKPRTRHRDPVSGAQFYAQFYFPWMILSSVRSDNRSCILSAFCTCK